MRCFCLDVKTMVVKLDSCVQLYRYSRGLLISGVFGIIIKSLTYNKCTHWWRNFGKIWFRPEVPLGIGGSINTWVSTPNSSINWNIIWRWYSWRVPYFFNSSSFGRRWINSSPIGASWRFIGVVFFLFPPDASTKRGGAWELWDFRWRHVAFWIMYQWCMYGYFWVDLSWYIVFTGLSASPWLHMETCGLRSICISEIRSIPRSVSLFLDYPPLYIMIWSTPLFSPPQNVTKSADFLSAPLALTGYTWIWNWSYEQNKQAAHR